MAARKDTEWVILILDAEQTIVVGTPEGRVPFRLIDVGSVRHNVISNWC